MESFEHQNGHCFEQMSFEQMLHRRFRTTEETKESSKAFFVSLRKVSTVNIFIFYKELIRMTLRKNYKNLKKCEKTKNNSKITDIYKKFLKKLQAKYQEIASKLQNYEKNMEELRKN